LALIQGDAPVVEPSPPAADDPLLQVDVEALPYAWGGPVGSARVRVLAEDFRVVEEPRVTPTGEGEHAWLYVRKRDSNTQWVARELARHARVAPSAVGYAGLKDRRAVAEQWFSVHLPGRPDPDWKTVGGQAFEVLEARRHGRKLRTGTLLGNRFRLRLRDVQAPVEAIEQRLLRLRARGFPNYFGAQRFGRGAGNLATGAQLLFGGKARLPRQQRSLCLSAVRSALFNRVLAARVADGSWERVLPGEALQLAGRSACFVAEAVDAALVERLRAGDVQPTGPLCGAGDALVRGQAAQYEQRLLQPCAHWIDALRRFRVDAARRSLRAVPGDLVWTRLQAGDWIVEFFLPAGAYATSLLREVLRLEEQR
jgi:tRNA pseudouridine13 synthase